MPSWLLPLLFMAVTAGLGYWLGRLFGKDETQSEEYIRLQSERDSYGSKFNDLDSKYQYLLGKRDTWKMERAEWSNKYGLLKIAYGDYESKQESLQESHDGIQAELDALKLVTKDRRVSLSAKQQTAKLKHAGAPKKAINEVEVTKIVEVPDQETPDDLTKIEGIGPKIKQLLHDDGILSFRSLADAAVTRIQSVLDAAGSSYSMHDPGTWPEQSAMAADGKWDALKARQDELLGGK